MFAVVHCWIYIYRLDMARRSTRLETVESSDESDTEDMETSTADHPYDVLWKWEQQQKSSFFKQNKKSFPMYPYTEEKVKVNYSILGCVISDVIVYSGMTMVKLFNRKTLPLSNRTHITSSIHMLNVNRLTAAAR